MGKLNLDVMLEVFENADASEKYLVIEKIREAIARKRDIYSNKYHDLFYKISEFHIATMKDERDFLEKLLNGRDGMIEAGLGNAPASYVSGFQNFNVQIIKRIAELNAMIFAMQAEMKKRKLEEKGIK